MRRDFDALAAVNNELTLFSLAQVFAGAVDEVVAEGGDPNDDAAVLLLGSIVAFHTHADVNTVEGYRKLIDRCQSRIEQRDLQ